MKQILITFALLFSLAACDKEVSRVYLTDQIQIKKSSQSCSIGPGYCYACGFDFNVEYHCSYGMKLDCPGSQPTTIRITPYSVKHESGKYTRHEKVDTLSVDGECR